MQIIKRLSNDIACNIDEARDKIRTAYELKAEYPEAGAWYREMAMVHLNFNANGHATVKKMIDTYRASEGYKCNPNYADGMIDAWTAIHDDLVAKTAEVRAMIEGYK